ncbi:MAG: sortase B protein-sorting domain-containing protein [Candidatus Omnitrophica bacterium]|nr:sortase B protein-sorting domain-containing protein [Candidatus Omnitrophota bacterium]
MLKYSLLVSVSMARYLSNQVESFPRTSDTAVIFLYISLLYDAANS